MGGKPTFAGHYYPQLPRRVAAELNSATADYLLSVDPDEYLEYLVREAEFAPLEWHEESMTIEAYSDAQQERFRLRIPITPHPRRRDYLSYQPSVTKLGSVEPFWDFEGVDTLVLEVDASEGAVQRALDQVRFFFGARNRDIEEGNREVREQIRPIWEAKRQQLEAQRGTSRAALRKLNIPLHQDPNARARPIEIKPRQLSTVLDRPKPQTVPQDPALNRDDVIKLVDFIAQYARQFEVTPGPYANMKEEHLRDLLIGMMNAVYPGTTSGETFNKLGKVDITLQVGFGHILICECKFWQGAQSYSKALHQLFRYVAWRQSYGVMITFSKRRDMSKAVTSAQQVVSEDPSFTTGSLSDRSEEARFSSRHAHPQDTAKSMEVFHLFFDLSV